MPTYPGSPQLTVDALLKQPRLIARALTDLANKRFVADRVFAQGTPEMVAGGAAQYQKSESIYLTQDFEEVGVRAEFPRATWTEAVFTEAVRKFGLEVPISFESVRRNQMDQMARAERKLANGLVRFVDTLAMARLVSELTLTASASGDWSTAATNIISDIASARKTIADQEEGYDADTLIVNSAQELDLLVDEDIRNALPRETANSTVQTGRPPLLLGINQLLVTGQLSAGTVLLVNAKVVGTIADEQPAAGEGYVSYDPGAGQTPIHVKRYVEDGRDEHIVRAARFPAMWVAEPTAGFKVTGA